MTDTKDPGENVDTDDLWGQAMAEHEALKEEKASEANGDAVFQPMEESTVPASFSRELDMIRDIPVDMTVELGRTRMTIKHLLQLVQGSVIELDGLVGEPMDILINNYLIGKGEVMNMDNKFGIRITSIVTPSERAKKLSRID